MIVGGIDPGKLGGIAVVSELDDCETQLMPITDDGIVDTMKIVTFFTERDVEFIVIERSQVMSDKASRAMGGRKKMGTVSAFNYGYGAGQLRSIGQIMCPPEPRLITPQMWKRGFGLIKQDKNASRAKAVALFPRAADQFKRVMDHGRAEAALIAAFHLGMHTRGQ